MSLLELACESCTLKVDPPASGGTFVILPIGSGSLGSKVHCQSAEVYTAIAFTVTAVSYGSVVSGSGAGIITGTAAKIKVSGQAPVRKTDSLMITVTDVNPPYGTANVKVEVDDPGQDKAKAE
jgi:hypothetical protein